MNFCKLHVLDTMFGRLNEVLQSAADVVKNNLPNTVFSVV